FPTRLLPSQVEYVVTTEDGSAGYPGPVTSLLGRWLAWADVVYAAGPLITMEALAEQMRRSAPRRSGEVLLEETMACATGACLGCIIETAKGPLRACVDGPVFDIAQVLWHERVA